MRLLRDGYDAVSRLREANGGADWFAARMLGRRALVVRGEEGVRTFYDPELVTRKGAVPAPVRLLLFGPGAVHGLNGDAHTRRKQIFLRIVDRPVVERLAGEVSLRLEEAAAGWPASGPPGGPAASSARSVTAYATPRCGRRWPGSRRSGISRPRSRASSC